MTIMTERDAMEHCGIDRLVDTKDLGEQLFRIRRGVLPHVVDPDSEAKIDEWMGITVSISIDAADAIMSAFEQRVGQYHFAMLISVQKWCVAHCFAPWLLDDRFAIGKCYYGNYGNAPHRTSHIHQFVHKQPRPLRR